MDASRTVNLAALRLITVAAVCLCLLAITASVLIAVFGHVHPRPTTQLPTPSSAGFPGSSGTQHRPQGKSLSSSTFQTALQHRKQDVLKNGPRGVKNRPRQFGGFTELIAQANRARFYNVSKPTSSATEQ